MVGVFIFMCAALLQRYEFPPWASLVALPALIPNAAMLMSDPTALALGYTAMWIAGKGRLENVSIPAISGTLIGIAILMRQAALLYVIVVPVFVLLRYRQDFWRNARSGYIIIISLIMATFYASMVRDQTGMFTVDTTGLSQQLWGRLAPSIASRGNHREMAKMGTENLIMAYSLPDGTTPKERVEFEMVHAIAALKESAHLIPEYIIRTVPSNLWASTEDWRAHYNPPLRKPRYVFLAATLAMAALWIFGLLQLCRQREWRVCAALGVLLALTLAQSLLSGWTTSGRIMLPATLATAAIYGEAFRTMSRSIKRRLSHD